MIKLYMAKNSTKQTLHKLYETMQTISILIVKDNQIEPI